MSVVHFPGARIVERPVGSEKAAIEAGAAKEAEWDGRTFSALGRADKERYVKRFADGLSAYFAALKP